MASSTMEAKLAAYRRGREGRFVTFWATVRNLTLWRPQPSNPDTSKQSSNRGFAVDPKASNMKIAVMPTTRHNNQLNCNSELSHLGDDTENDSLQHGKSLSFVLPRLGIWLLLLICAVSLGLVSAFLMLSLFYALWLGTGYGPSSTTTRGPNSRRQLSAYSVFNPGCQALPGTLKAEQLERELMYGPAGCK
uniref:SAYSvFN domain-containing protein 1 n=1 Tax=Myxine glutinosa TaxID=7769 RepID=UPI00358F641F